MKNLLIFCFVGVANVGLFAQGIVLDQTVTVEQMIEDFFNSDQVTVSNIQYTGDESSVSFFDASGTDLGIDAGIFLSSGFVESIWDVGAGGTSGSTAGESDDDLAILASFEVTDAAVIEFDFEVSESGTFDFKYVFGSEEYPEFVNSSFNDAFGFLLSGLGYSGPYSNNSENIAVIPDTGIEVTINNVNDGANSMYYVDNSASQYNYFDGLTVCLPSSFESVPGETYHIKIVVGDSGDSAFDSGVFLSYNSLGNIDSLVPPTEFSIVQNGSTIELENKSRYARTYSWDFGNDVTSEERFPGPVEYTENGEYEVVLTTQNYCCTQTFSQTIEISDVVSTEDTFLDNVKLSPNPAHDQMQIIGINASEIDHVEIHSILGQAIQLKAVIQNGRLDLEGINKGMYVLKLDLKTGQSTVIPFTKF